MATIVKIQMRRDTSSNWSISEIPLLEGEPGFDTTLNILKIGPLGGAKWRDIGESGTFYSSRQLPDGTEYSNYIYWDGSNWVVGGSKINIGRNSGGGGGPVPMSDNMISIGTNAGNIQGDSSIAIGTDSGATQENSAIAIGASAGLSQLGSSIAIGDSAGNTQSDRTIAIGLGAGYNQQSDAIAIGSNAGAISQGTNAIAIGSPGAFTGAGVQGDNAIAIGNAAGPIQENNAIAIGYLAGGTAQQHANSIIINASGAGVVTAQYDSCYIAPIRQVSLADASTFLPLYYDPVNLEIVRVG